MKKFFKHVLRSLLGIVILLVILVFVVPYCEKVDTTSVEQSEAWMANLSDSLYLSEINIPGSHDSSTQYVNLPLFMRCQSFNYETQLNKGVRYFDLRLDSDDDTLILVHDFAKCTINFWPFSEKLTVSDVLDTMYTFLANHPTETIILNVKKESDDTIEHIKSLLRDLINKKEEAWYLGTTIPTLSDARGHIVYGHRYDDQDGINLDFSDQGGYSDTTLNIAETSYTDYTVYVQDRYGYNTSEKWEAFTVGLAVSSQTDKNALCINFLSTHGHSALGHPFYYANRLNNNLLAYDLESCGTFNIIVLDFVTSPLCYKVYSTNF